MKWRNIGLAGLATAFLAPPVVAQPRDLPIPPAQSTTLPPGISVKKTPIGDIYVDAQGRTLYGMATGNLRLDTRNPNTWCSGPCAEVWEAVAPPPGVPPAAVVGAGGRGGGAGQAGGAQVGGAAGGAGAQGQAAAQQGAQAAQARGGQGQGLGLAGRGGAPAGPDWTQVMGVNGPQLMYKGSNLVFTRKGDVPGSTKWDGNSTFLWNALRYVPPVPKLVAPIAVTPVYVDGAYAMVDKEQRVLYTLEKPTKCVTACEKPVPFKAGFVAQGIGDWTVSRDGDTPQWLYRGKPVFVSQGRPKSVDVPQGAAVLRP